MKLVGFAHPRRAEISITEFPSLKIDQGAVGLVGSGAPAVKTHPKLATQQPAQRPVNSAPVEWPSSAKWPLSSQGLPARYR